MAQGNSGGRRLPTVVAGATRAAAGLLLAAFIASAVQAPASAGWREDLGTFRIGILSEPGAGSSVAGLSEIKRAYRMALGLPVEILVAENYAALIQAQAEGRLEYAIYSATAYATASSLCSCVEPVAAPVAGDGSTGLRAALIARDGRLTSVEEIARRRVAVVEGDSIAGFALPGSALAEAFDREGMIFIKAASASAAETMLVEGSVDAIFGWLPSSDDQKAEFAGGTLERLIVAGIDPAALKVVWTSGLLRFGPHAIRADLNPEVRRSLTIFLTSMLSQTPVLYDLVERHYGGGFRAVTEDDYSTAVTMVERIAALENAP